MGRQWWVGLGLGTGALLLGLFFFGQRNFDQIQLHQALLGQAPAAPLATQWAAAPNPQRAYGLGLLALKTNEVAVAETWLQQALAGNERYLELVRRQQPASAALAQAATTHYPANAAAWDWRGDVTLPLSPTLALTYYQRAAELRPLDNLIWEKVGALAHQQNQATVAQAAFQHACDLNPQRNGACLSAAQLALAAGETATCLEYYQRGGYSAETALSLCK